MQCTGAVVGQRMGGSAAMAGAHDTDSVCEVHLKFVKAISRISEDDLRLAQAVSPKTSRGTVKHKLSTTQPACPEMIQDVLLTIDPTNSSNLTCPTTKTSVQMQG